MDQCKGPGGAGVWGAPVVKKWAKEQTQDTKRKKVNKQNKQNKIQ